MKQKKHRLLIYAINICINLTLIIITVCIGIFTKDKAAIVALSILCVYLLNATVSIWIVNSKIRTNETKLAWLLSFLLFPIIALFIYFIWGRSPYTDNRKAQDYKKMFRRYTELYPNFKNVHIDKTDFLFRDLSEYASSVRSVKSSYNNNFEVIKDNQDFYSEVLKSIESAKQFIFIQYYIIDQGFFFQSFVDKLIKKAKEGVKIYLIYDRFGCDRKFTPEMLVYLLQFENIEIAKFESNRDIKYRSTNNFRNHRKVLIIDNDLAIYGGSNIADEYLSLARDHPNWKDLNFKIRGPLVINMLIDFCKTWDFNANLPYVLAIGDYINSHPFLKPLAFLINKLFLPWRWKKAAQKAILKRKMTKPLIDIIQQHNFFEYKLDENTKEITNRSCFVLTGPRYYSDAASELLLIAFFNANKSIKIISPYLQPNDEILAALKAASFRKIKVDMIMPGSCDDKWFLLNMNRMFYQPLLEANVNIREYSGFIHTKLIIIDDELVITGSFNLDLRSLTSNYESFLILKDKKTISSLNEYWSECFNNSKMFTKKDLIKHISLKNSFIKAGLEIIRPLL